MNLEVLLIFTYFHSIRNMKKELINDNLMLFKYVSGIPGYGNMIYPLRFALQMRVCWVRETNQLLIGQEVHQGPFGGKTRSLYVKGILQQLLIAVVLPGGWSLAKGR